MIPQAVEAAPRDVASPRDPPWNGAHPTSRQKHAHLKAQRHPIRPKNPKQRTQMDNQTPQRQKSRLTKVRRLPNQRANFGEIFETVLSPRASPRKGSVKAFRSVVDSVDPLLHCYADDLAWQETLDAMCLREERLKQSFETLLLTGSTQTSGPLALETRHSGALTCFATDESDGSDSLDGTAHKVACLSTSLIAQVKQRIEDGKQQLWDTDAGERGAVTSAEKGVLLTELVNAHSHSDIHLFTATCQTLVNLYGFHEETSELCFDATEEREDEDKEQPQIAHKDPVGFTEETLREHDCKRLVFSHSPDDVYPLSQMARKKALRALWGTQRSFIDITPPGMVPARSVVPFSSDSPSLSFNNTTLQQMVSEVGVHLRDVFCGRFRHRLGKVVRTLLTLEREKEGDAVHELLENVYYLRDTPNTNTNTTDAKRRSREEEDRRRRLHSGCLLEEPLCAHDGTLLRDYYPKKCVSAHALLSTSIEAAYQEYREQVPHLPCGGDPSKLSVFCLLLSTTSSAEAVSKLLFMQSVPENNRAESKLKGLGQIGATLQHALDVVMADAFFDAFGLDCDDSSEEEGEVKEMVTKASNLKRIQTELREKLLFEKEFVRAMRDVEAEAKAENGSATSDSEDDSESSRQDKRRAAPTQEEVAAATADLKKWIKVFFCALSALETEHRTELPKAATQHHALFEEEAPLFTSSSIALPRDKDVTNTTAPVTGAAKVTKIAVPVPSIAGAAKSAAKAIPMTTISGTAASVAAAATPTVAKAIPMTKPTMATPTPTPAAIAAVALAAAAAAADISHSTEGGLHIHGLSFALPPVNGVRHVYFGPFSVISHPRRVREGADFCSTLRRVTAHIVTQSRERQLLSSQRHLAAHGHTVAERSLHTADTLSCVLAQWDARVTRPLAIRAPFIPLTLNNEDMLRGRALQACRRGDNHFKDFFDNTPLNEYSRIQGALWGLYYDKQGDVLDELLDNLKSTDGGTNVVPISLCAATHRLCRFFGEHEMRSAADKAAKGVHEWGDDDAFHLQLRRRRSHNGYTDRICAVDLLYFFIHLLKVGTMDQFRSLFLQGIDDAGNTPMEEINTAFTELKSGEADVNTMAQKWVKTIIFLQVFTKTLFRERKTIIIKTFASKTRVEALQGRYTAWCGPCFGLLEAEKKKFKSLNAVAHDCDPDEVAVEYKIQNCPHAPLGGSPWAFLPLFEVVKVASVTQRMQDGEGDGKTSFYHEIICDVVTKEEAEPFPEEVLESALWGIRRINKRCAAERKVTQRSAKLVTTETHMRTTLTTEASLHTAKLCLLSEALRVHSAATHAASQETARLLLFKSFLDTATAVHNDCGVSFSYLCVYSEELSERQRVVSECTQSIYCDVWFPALGELERVGREGIVVEVQEASALLALERSFCVSANCIFVEECVAREQAWVLYCEQSRRFALAYDAVSIWARHVFAEISSREEILRRTEYKTCLFAVKKLQCVLMHGWCASSVALKRNVLFAKHCTSFADSSEVIIRDSIQQRYTHSVVGFAFEVEWMKAISLLFQRQVKVFDEIVHIFRVQQTEVFVNALLQREKNSAQALQHEEKKERKRTERSFAILCAECRIAGCVTLETQLRDGIEKQQSLFTRHILSTSVIAIDAHNGFTRIMQKHPSHVLCKLPTISEHSLRSTKYAGAVTPIADPSLLFCALEKAEVQVQNVFEEMVVNLSDGASVQETRAALAVMCVQLYRAFLDDNEMNDAAVLATSPLLLLVAHLCFGIGAAQRIPGTSASRNILREVVNEDKWTQTRLVLFTAMQLVGTTPPTPPADKLGTILVSAVGGKGNLPLLGSSVFGGIVDTDVSAAFVRRGRLHRAQLCEVLRGVAHAEWWVLHTFTTPYQSVCGTDLQRFCLQALSTKALLCLEERARFADRLLQFDVTAPSNHTLSAPSQQVTTRRTGLSSTTQTTTAEEDEEEEEEEEETESDEEGEEELAAPAPAALAPPPPPPPPAAAAEVVVAAPPPEWSCSQCTLVNPFDATTCSVCGHQYTAQQPPKGTAEEEYSMPSDSENAGSRRQSQAEGAQPSTHRGSLPQADAVQKGRAKVSGAMDGGDASSGSSAEAGGVGGVSTRQKEQDAEESESSSEEEEEEEEEEDEEEEEETPTKAVSPGSSPLVPKKQTAPSAAMPSAAGPSATVQWNCTRCTLSNPASATTCEMCDADRPTSAAPVKQQAPPPLPAAAKVVAAASPPPGWSCSQCTLVNPFDATTCSVCGHQYTAQQPPKGTAEEEYSMPSDSENAGSRRQSQAEGAQPSTHRGSLPQADAVQKGRAKVSGAMDGGDASSGSSAEDGGVGGVSTRRGTLPQQEETPTKAVSPGSSPLVPKKQTAPSAAMPSAAGPSATGQWNCTRCTLSNPASATTCEMCDADRPTPAAPVKQAPPPPPGWSCSQCTLVNPFDATTCSVCGHTPARTPPPVGTAEEEYSMPSDSEHDAGSPRAQSTRRGTLPQADVVPKGRAQASGAMDGGDDSSGESSAEDEEKKSANTGHAATTVNAARPAASAVGTMEPDYDDEFTSSEEG